MNINSCGAYYQQNLICHRLSMEVKSRAHTLLYIFVTLYTIKHHVYVYYIV